MNHKIYACISGGTCVSGLYAFLQHAMPILQVVCVLISIAAGLKALFGKK
jgi:threonine dehydratase